MRHVTISLVLIAMGIGAQAFAHAKEVQYGVLNFPGLQEDSVESAVLNGELTAALQGPGVQVGDALAESLDLRKSLQGTFIRVQSVSAITTATPTKSEVDTFLTEAWNWLKRQNTQWGEDLRGRTLKQDFDDYIAAPMRRLSQASSSTAAAPTVPSETFTLETYRTEAQQRLEALAAYWAGVGSLNVSKNLWTMFLEHNHLPPQTPQSDEEMSNEAALKDSLKGTAPSQDWVQRESALEYAYNHERMGRAVTLTDPVFHRRTTPCPPRAARTSGAYFPRKETSQNPRDFYPSKLVRDKIPAAVTLSLRVSATGCITDIAILMSSGSDEMDDAARAWAETVRYLPADKDGAPVDSVADLQFRFGPNDPIPSLRRRDPFQ